MKNYRHKVIFEGTAWVQLTLIHFPYNITKPHFWVQVHFKEVVSKKKKYKTMLANKNKKKTMVGSKKEKKNTMAVNKSII